MIPWIVACQDHRVDRLDKILDAIGYMGNPRDRSDIRRYRAILSPDMGDFRAIEKYFVPVIPRQIFANECKWTARRECTRVIAVKDRCIGERMPIAFIEPDNPKP